MGGLWIISSIPAQNYDITRGSFNGIKSNLDFAVKFLAKVGPKNEKLTEPVLPRKSSKFDENTSFRRLEIC